MKVKNSVTSILFKAGELKQELVLDALDEFLSRIKHLDVRLDAIYPADPMALPFAMYISSRLSVPIKTENFLSKKNQILTVFSILDTNKSEMYSLSERFISQKIKVIRKLFPFSPSILIASNKKLNVVDFQLLKVEKLLHISSYKFLSLSRKNYFYPLYGEFTYFDANLWKTAEQETKNLEKARRIRDNASKFLMYDTPRIEPLDSDMDISIWEKFRKNLLVKPSVKEKKRKSIGLKCAKLINIKDKQSAAAITFLLEYLSQNLEMKFPTFLAYSNYEIVPRKGVLIIPSALEVMSGVDLKLEIIMRSTRLKTDGRILVSTLKRNIRRVVKELLNETSFRPEVDVVTDMGIKKLTIYLSWFIDGEMIKRLNGKVNKKWLFARLYERKKIKLRQNELLRELEGFSFSPENIESVFTKIRSIKLENPLLLRSCQNKIWNILNRNSLWPLIGVYALRNEEDETLNFLLSLKGYESIHEYWACENAYYVPIIAKRIERPNWERLIKENLNVKIKAEPLNPDNPLTYVVTDENGKPLGHIPSVISHYLFAKESIGKKITCEKLYVDPIIFSNDSYWLRINVKG